MFPRPASAGLFHARFQLNSEVLMGGRGSSSASSTARRIVVGKVGVADTGSLDISNPAAFVASMGDAPKALETERGRALAKAYVSGFGRDMTEPELSQAVRMLTYRGSDIPRFVSDSVDVRYSNGDTVRIRKDGAGSRVSYSHASRNVGSGRPSKTSQTVADLFVRALSQPDVVSVERHGRR